MINIFKKFILGLALLTSPYVFAEWGVNPIDIAESPESSITPSMGVSLNGNIVLSWVNSVSGSVNVSIIEPGSTIVNTSEILSTGVNQPVSCSRSTNGNAVACWVNEQAGQTIQASYYNGTTWTIATEIAPEITTGSYSNVQSLIDENGNVLVVWAKLLPGNRSLEYATYNAASGIWAGVNTIYSSSGFLLFQIALQPNSGGKSTIVFTESSTSKLWSSEYTFGSGWNFPLTEILSDPGINFPSVQVSEDGTAVTAWVAFGRIKTTSRVGGIWNNSPIVLSNPSESSFSPIVKVNPDGHVIVMWSASGGPIQVYKAATTLAGSSSWIQTGIVSPVSPLQATRGQLAIDILGNGIAIWIINSSPFTVSGSTLAVGTTDWIPTSDLGQAPNSNVLLNIAYDNLGRAVAFFPALVGQSTNDQLLFGDFFEINLAPLPPQNFTGALRSTKFSTQTEYNHRLQWNASPSGDVIQYRLYRNGVLIATIASSPGSAYTYNDHNRRKNEVDTYTLTAVNANGLESVPVTLAL